MKHASHRVTPHIYQNNVHIGGLLTLKDFFRLDRFGEKNSFFEKKIVMGDFEERIRLEPSNLVG